VVTEESLCLRGEQMSRRTLWVLILLALLLLVAVDAKKKKPKKEPKEEDDNWNKPSKKRDIKDWGQVKNKDWETIEDEWMEDEEEDPDQPFKFRKGPDGKRLPPEHKGPKTEMGFVTLLPKITKAKTEELAGHWASLMATGGVDAKGYAVEDNKILFVTEKGAKDMLKVKDFVLEQKEVVEFEWQQQKFPKPKKGSKKKEL